MAGSNSGPSSNTSNNNQVMDDTTTYPKTDVIHNEAFKNLNKNTDMEKYIEIKDNPTIIPIIITGINEPNAPKITAELKKLKVYEQIEQIKITAHKNILVYFKDEATRICFFEKKTFLDGTINELKTKQDELKLVIKVDYETFKEEYENANLNDMISNHEELKSINPDKITHMTIITCKNNTTKNQLLDRKKIKIGLIIYNIVQFEKKRPLLIICYSCGKPNHTRNSCRSKSKKCIRCSSTDHTSKDCHNKNDKDKLKCPNCNEKHPATYAGCLKYQEFLTKKTNSVDFNRNPNRQLPNSYAATAREIEPNSVSEIKKHITTEQQSLRSLIELQNKEIFNLKDKVNTLEKFISTNNLKLVESFVEISKTIMVNEIPKKNGPKNHSLTEKTLISIRSILEANLKIDYDDMCKPSYSPIYKNRILPPSNESINV